MTVKTLPYELTLTMISRKNASISKCIIHKVGNKHNNTKNAFSEKDYTCPIHKTVGMMKCIVKFYD